MLHAKAMNETDDSAAAREAIAAREAKVRARFGSLYDEALRIIQRHDPMGFGDDVPDDEYSPEVETILPRLLSAESTSDAVRIAHEEFVSWFDADLAGHRSDYRELGADLWVAYQNWRS